MIKLAVGSSSVELVTDAGVFSPRQIDGGTRHLLKDAPLPFVAEDRSRNVLDLGCGYGPIAISLAMRMPMHTIWAIDINERALALTNENVQRLQLTNVRVCHESALDDSLRFAAIYSNPPIKSGKQPLHAMLRTWLPRLEQNGSAYLVVHKHLGADSLARWLVDEGYQVSRISSHAGYRTLHVTTLA